LPEQELRRRVKSESGQNVLDVNNGTFFEAILQLGGRLICMTVKDFKVTNPILVEERAGDGSMEPAAQCMNKTEIVELLKLLPPHVSCVRYRVVNMK